MGLIKRLLGIEALEKELERTRFTMRLIEKDTDAILKHLGMPSCYIGSDTISANSIKAERINLDEVQINPFPVHSFGEQVHVPEHWTQIPTFQGQIACPYCTEPWGEDDGVEMHHTELVRMKGWQDMGVDFTGFIPDTGMADPNNTWGRRRTR